MNNGPLKISIPSFRRVDEHSSYTVNAHLTLLDTRHYGPKTLQTQDTSAPMFNAEVFGQFGSFAEVSIGYFELSAKVFGHFSSIN